VPRVDGPSRDDIARRGDAFTDLVLSAIWHTLNTVTSRFIGTVGLDDIASIRETWKTYVPGLRDHLGQAYLDAAAQTRVGQRDLLISVLKKNGTALVSSLVAVADQPFEIPQVANAQAESLMASAENRLANVGNEVWENARGELLTGLQRGEDIPTLRDRVSAATDFTTTRAELVARSEVASAMNAGALAQMRQVDVPGMTKEWIAVDDGRVRADHIAANGEKVPLDGVFSNGLEPGEEPNCRCTYGFNIPDEDTFAQNVTGCDSPMLSSLLASVDTVVFAGYNPEYAKAYREKQRLKRQAERDAGEVVPTPKPVTPPPRPVEKPPPLQQAVQQLQRDTSLSAVSACEVAAVQDDAVTWHDENPFFAKLEPGDNARFNMDMRFTMSDRALKDAGIKDAEVRERLLKLNQKMGERFGEPFTTVERAEASSQHGAVVAYVRNGDTLGVTPKLLTDRVTLKDQVSGWVTRGSGKLEDVIVHEHGHYFLQGYSGAPWRSGARLQDIVVKAERAARAAGAPDGVLGGTLSKYSMTSRKEAEAELWKLYHMGGATRPQWVIKWGETLLREMGLDTTPLCVDLGLCDAIAKCGTSLVAAAAPSWCSLAGAVEKYASKDVYEKITQQALEKIANAPVPTRAAIQKAQLELEKARAGTGRAGGDARGGSAADRRKQRLNLFKEFGGEERGYVPCHGCGIKTHWADPFSTDNPHGYPRFERGKIFVKCQGGGYQLVNLLPECFGCNRSRNDKMIRVENGC
jgi:SPP1 gp7 family putative phage head morphogenesis protein